MEETKRQKFQRLAEARTNRIIEQLDILGNLSNRSNYEYTKEEVNKIFRTIERALKRVERQFDDPNEFTL
ncbi:MAG: hypothetical protein ACOX02_00200 [Acholeplasmatales bacterium]